MAFFPFNVWEKKGSTLQSGTVFHFSQSGTPDTVLASPVALFGTTFKGPGAAFV